jgi:hypothetical protein
MKKILLVIVAFSAQFMAAQDADVRKTIDTFFVGLNTTDTLKIQTVCSKDMILQTIAEKPSGGVLTGDDIKEFYKSIGSVPKTLKIEERILAHEIKVDGSLAHAWTPYEFYVNGKLSHGGTNSFTLFKENGAWKIIHIIDTRKMAKK